MIEIIVIEEILIANGLTVLMMWFLLLCRRKNRESLHEEDKLYDGMAIVNLAGALSETIAFLVDGNQFTGCRQINYISNSICFIGTVSIGLLWCLYVELRIYRNYKRIFKKVRVVMFPWIVEVIMVLCNLPGTGIMFKISKENVYQRTAGSLVGYISLILYFAYSIYLVYHSKKQGVNVNFFPVIYFVGPCFAGVLIQFLFYGITSSWVLVAIALIFVQMQTYAENLYMDELSGLYNRRYLNAVLSERKFTKCKSLYGIMMDVNDFKYINDTYGHLEGDALLIAVADTLRTSVRSYDIVGRIGGDEFVVYLSNVTDRQNAMAVAEKLCQVIRGLSTMKKEWSNISASIGISFADHPDIKMEELYISADKAMYSAKGNGRDQYQTL